MIVQIGTIVQGYTSTEITVAKLALNALRNCQRLQTRYDSMLLTTAIEDYNKRYKTYCSLQRAISTAGGHMAHLVALTQSVERAAQAVAFVAGGQCTEAQYREAHYE